MDIYSGFPVFRWFYEQFIRPHNASQLSTGTDVFPFLQFPCAARVWCYLNKDPLLQTTALKPDQNILLHLLVRACHISVCTDTALGQAYPASLKKFPKPWLVVVGMLASSLLGQEHFNIFHDKFYTAVHHEKQQYNVLCPKDYANRQDSHPVSRGS